MLLHIIERETSLFFIRAALDIECGAFARAYTLHELIEVFSHDGINRHLVAFPFLSAFEMPWFSTLYASKKLQLVLCVIVSTADLETPDFLVPIQSAPVTLDNIRLRAVDSQMADLVALEAYLLSALERIVRVLPAQYARSTLRLVGAVPGPVAALAAVLAPEQWILAQEVPRLLGLHHLVKLFFLV